MTAAAPAHFHAEEPGRPCEGEIWQPEPRCLRAAHRVAGPDGTPPRQTREYLRSFRTWPLALFEITSRMEARLRGSLRRRGLL